MGGACALAATAVALVPSVAAARPADGADATAAQGRPTITLSGSTSVAPLATQLIRGYLRGPGRNRVRFRLAQGGSDVGVRDAAEGRVSIGMSSRDARPADPGGLLFNRIARDAICIVTNPANRVGNVSQDQVRALFGGGARDWGGIGQGVSGTVNVYVRTDASGTQDAFQNLFMGGSRGTRVFSGAQRLASNGLIQNRVRSDRNGVGYVSLAFAEGLNVASYEGVACTLRNAAAGTYTGSRNFWFVTRGRPEANSPVQRFIAWVQQNPRAQRIIATEWVPVR
jgi:phosphate transport system substrate-binding protein